MISHAVHKAHIVLWFAMADVVVTPNYPGYRVLKGPPRAVGCILSMPQWQFLKKELGNRAVCL